MSERYDAIIIGAGIIGACTAFELAKRGWRTLNVDKLPAAGYGSTGSSCAIIRTHYSTLDGSALAYESYFCWDDWADYLGVRDERGLAAFHKTGCLVMKTPINGHLKSVCAQQDALGIPWEDWGPEQIAARFGFYDLQRVRPAQAAGRSGVRRSRWREPARRGVLPLRRLHRRSAARHPQRAARRRSQRCRVPLQRRGHGDPPRERPRCRHHAAHRRADRCAGRGQRRRPALVQDQPHGRGRRRHDDQDPGAQAGGGARAVPGRLRLRAHGPGDLGFRHRLLLPAGDRQPPPDRQRGSAVRRSRVGRPGRLRSQFLGAVAGAGAARRAAHPEPAGDEPGQGRGRSVRRHRRLDPDLRHRPTCPASTWRSAPAAISSRTRRWPAP